jgi:5-methyltetrahydropteroyltriglutamate--homocysteine methyltransferase
VPINIFAYQHGLYPRSEKVVSATRSLDRGRVDQAAVRDAFQQDEAQFIRVQQQAGVDFFSDGLISWQDIFRPLAESHGPLRPGPLVRWFDTNTFFRAPDLSGDIVGGVKASNVLPSASVPGPRVASLPSPYMFSRAAEVGGKDRNALMVEIAQKLVRPAIEAAVGAGARVIHLEEPWLAYFGIDQADWGPFEESLRALRTGNTATVILHCYFGDAGRFIDRLRKLPVDGIGVDLVETDVSELGSGWDKDLMIGCLNGRSSLIESLESTVELARRVADTVHPRNLYLSSTCDLEFLPTGVADKKVQRLGEAAKRLKELVSV